MKKFMKGCAITALVLFLVGIVMAVVAGAIKGPQVIGEMVNSVSHGRVNFALDDLVTEVEKITSDGHNLQVFEEETFYNIDDSMIFNNNYTIYTSDVEKVEVGTDIRNLDIEAGGCSLKIVASEDEKFYVEADRVGKFQCYVKERTLHLKSTSTLKTWNVANGCSITLYVPKNMAFHEVEMELGAGLITMNDLIADSAELEVGAGGIEIDYLQADECDASVGMGSILANDMRVRKMDAEVGMGHMELNGNIEGNLNAECSMGAIELYLSNSEEEFNYIIEAAMGGVTLGNNEYNGLAREKYIDNNATKEMKLESAMGGITVLFDR